MTTIELQCSSEKLLEALEFLACPRCTGDLELCKERGDRDKGERETIVCSAGCGQYPIHNGVLQMLPEMTDATGEASDYQAPTGQSFAAQWDMFQYGNTTWGVTVEERIRVVLHELNWSESDLDGKVILDAGCGNGTLSQGLADRGATVVAIDLSHSVLRAQQYCSSRRVHYIQGNLFFPPFKPRVFDAIYSCGVFHHTPDTRRCFDALVPTLKNGARYFVWLYAKRSKLFNYTVEPLMKLTRRLPSWLLIPACRGLAAPVEAGSRLLTRLGLTEYTPRNLPDRTVQLHDLLSPTYVWYHSFSETKRWADDQGLEDVTETDYSTSDRRSPELNRILDKYRGVCRPGSGMLCHKPGGECKKRTDRRAATRVS